jgi:hypothetical protein
MNRKAIRQELAPLYAEIRALAADFALTELNKEYAALVDVLVEEIERQAPGLVLKGRAKGWAGAVVYVLGQVNFLFDPSQQPHMRADELCKRFGASQASISPKARQIREALGIIPMDPRFSLPAMMASNPLVWMLTVNGFLVDVREMPREVQVIAYEKGLIPYIPADREEE